MKETIEILKLAGIKIWMVTGDKQETARNIAYSSGLFDQSKEPVYLDQNNLPQIQGKKGVNEPIEKRSIFRWSRKKKKENKTVLTNPALFL